MTPDSRSSFLESLRASVPVPRALAAALGAAVNRNERALRRVSDTIEGVEKRPGMYAWSAEALEATMWQAVGMRQLLWGHGDECDINGLHAKFVASVAGEDTSHPLWSVLKEHGMLGRGRLDHFGDLPRLLGDFARWVAQEWPPR